MTQYTALITTTTDSVDPMEVSGFGVYPDWCCPACHRVRRGTPAIDLVVDQRTLPSFDLNVVVPTLMGVIHVDLLAALTNAGLTQDLRLGSVTNDRGRLLPRHRTFLGRHNLIVRGDREPGYRICETCGECLYFAMGRRFVYPAPPREVDVFVDAGDLIFSPRAWSRLQLPRLRGIAVDPVLVADEPLDGFPELQSYFDWDSPGSRGADNRAAPILARFRKGFSEGRFLLRDIGYRRVPAWEAWHSRQGFARLPGCVALGALVDHGVADVTVVLGPYDGAPFQRVIALDLEVPSGTLILGSPGDTWGATRAWRIPPGPYRLVACQNLVEQKRDGLPWECMRLHLQPAPQPKQSQIVTCDPRLDPPDPLVETAAAIVG